MMRRRLHILINHATVFLGLCALVFQLPIGMYIGVVLLSWISGYDHWDVSLWAIGIVTVALIGWLSWALRRMRSLLGLGRAAEIAREARPELHAALEKFAKAARVTVPRLFEMPISVPNAVVVGASKEPAEIILTTGLLERLSPDETEAVLACFVARIRHSDPAAVAFLAVVCPWTAFLSEVLALRIIRALRDPAFLPGFDKSGLVVQTLLAAASILKAVGLAAWPLRLMLSRRRFLFADAAAVELTGNPDALIRALIKLDTEDAHRPDVPSAVRDLSFFDPVRSTVDRLASTHPPVEVRIEALLQAGGRLPDPA